MDEVLVVASSRSLPAVHQQQFYVSISRGRERCQIFTDDTELLRSHVTRSRARLAAVEVLPRMHRQKFVQNILQRGHRFLKRFRQRITQSVSTERNIHEIEPTHYEHQRNPPAISASSPRDNPCFGSDTQTAALDVIAEDGISYLLPYAQFLFAERISNPALEKEPDAPPEKMLIRFALAEVVVLAAASSPLSATAESMN